MAAFFGALIASTIIISGYYKSKQVEGIGNKAGVIIGSVIIGFAFLTWFTPDDLNVAREAGTWTGYMLMAYFVGRKLFSRT
jgi:hypothetical protein